MSKVMKWQYSGEADITLGKEVHINPLPKIALYTTISVILIACVLGFIFRDYLYDLSINPQLVLKYVNKTDNGYEVDVPYQYDFKAENFIDEVNTREYEAFMNPNITEYIYSIEGTVDTNILGSYPVIYNSNNRANQQQITLIVNVKDDVAPTATLQNPLTHKELTKEVDGSYKPIFIVRNKPSTKEYYGTKSWKPEDFVLDISDNYSELTKISIVYPDKPDWSGKEAEYKELIYSFIDESENKTEIILPIYVVSLEEYETQEIKTDIAGLNEDIQEQINQIAQAEQDKKQTDSDNSKKDDSGSGTSTDDGNAPRNSDIDPNDDDSWRSDDWKNTPENDDGTHTGRNPQLSADSFTWSVSADGPFTSSAFWNRARAHLHYYDYDKNDAITTGGAIIEYQIEGPGTYSLHWQTPDGSLSCDQTFTVTE